MNYSSEEKRCSEENKHAPLYYLDGEAQWPRPQCWARSISTIHSLFPGQGSEMEICTYFPWSLVPRKYLDFLVPQTPLPTTLNQRLNFWHYNGHRGKMRMKGTQTKLQQLWHNRMSQSPFESRSVLYNPPGGKDPSLEKMCEEEVGEMDSCPQGHIPPAAPLAQSNKVNKAIQCDMTWLEYTELDRSPASLPGGRKGAGEELVLCGDLGRKEVGEQDSRPFTAQLAQSNKIDEAIHCDTGWVEDAELENSPEQMPLVSEESWNYITMGPRKMSRSRKLSEARIAFLKGKNDVAPLPKEITSLDISDACESEDKASETEWLFADKVSGLSSKESFDWEES